MPKFTPKFISRFRFNCWKPLVAALALDGFLFLTVFVGFRLLAQNPTSNHTFMATQDATNPSSNEMRVDSTVDFRVVSDEAWRNRLNAEEYRVLRRQGTERPYTGIYEQFWEAGTYVCKGCGAELFRSETKFDAGCGWPSFYEGIASERIREIKDYSHGMIRIEVRCAQCDGHLGHVFDDGPKPTGLRYCINSVSLGFKKAEQ